MDNGKLIMDNGKLIALSIIHYPIKFKHSIYFYRLVADS